jgi:aminopeptidase N
MKASEAVALPLLLLAFATGGAAAQASRGYTRADTLRGSFTTPGRTWWDVTFYDLRVAIQPGDSSIKGSNAIRYRVLEPGRELQIDLMTPLEVDSMIQDGRALEFRRDGNAFFARLGAPQPANASKLITIYYHGKPRAAARPPWEGGFTWGTDSLGRPWVVTSDQGVGASIWWPNKDTQADEPDSQRVAITVPKPMLDVGNGRLRKTRPNPDGTITYEWFVTQPLNNYAVAVNAGSYAHWSDVYEGEKGKLTLDFYPLDYHLAIAQRQWAEVKPMLQCFEHWFGPYPWYEDGYKLIETSHLGMEHQSAVAYGNGFRNGYRGRDLSATGHGLKWDFIIVHESAHEWWGNNLTTKDIADMWVHEGFANYSEGLYTECRFGKTAGAEYTVGSRFNLQGERPIITEYGVNAAPPIDQYYKAGNMLHTIRQLINDDERWRGILRGLNTSFRHQTVTGRQVEDYLSAQAGMDLSKVFDQYLRTAQIPVFNYRIARDTLWYRWQSVVPSFDMAVRVTTAPGELGFIKPTTRWKSMPVKVPVEQFSVDPNFYVAVLRDP